MENYEEPGSTKLSHRYVFISAVSCKGLTSFITYPHEVIRAR